MGANRDRTGESKMKTGGAEWNDRSNNNRAVKFSETNCSATTDFPCFHTICAERKMGSMVFDRAKRNQNHIGVLQRLLDVRTTHFCQGRWSFLYIEGISVSNRFRHGQPPAVRLRIPDSGPLS